MVFAGRASVRHLAPILGAPRLSALTPAPSSIISICRRRISDVAITRTGKPIIRVAGGRSSLGGDTDRFTLETLQPLTRDQGHTVTVFGATGFLGRYIVNRLARAGCTVVIPYRDEMQKRHLKVSGDLGRVVFMEFDLRNTQSIEESVRHSDVVYNLIGRDYETKNFTFEDTHVEGTSRIAEAVAKYDVDRYIHISSYNADKNSPSKFFRTKAEGEEVARSIFPETTLVRPAPLFGWEDRLLNRFAGEQSIWASNGLRERVRPAHVIDVGAALEVMLLDDNTAQQTYELYGPTEYSMGEIHEIAAKETLRKRPVVNVPKAIRAPGSLVFSKLLWFVETNPDLIEREFLDQVVDPAAKTFRDLGIEPAEMTTCTYEYLQGYRSNIYYDLPPMTEREKREEKKYVHVIDDQ